MADQLADAVRDMSVEPPPLEDANPNAVAYHVTNLKSKKNDKYNELKLSIANDVTYDGRLVGLPVVCLSTTLYNNDLPTTSPYPRNGTKDKLYKRVEVPLEQFKDYDWWEMSRGVDQVHLLFTNGHWSTMLRESIGTKFEVLNKRKYPFLQLHRAGWQRNNYKKREHSFVNIAIVHEVNVAGCKWDDVRHSGAKTGTQEEFPKKETDCRERWILKNVIGEPDAEGPEAARQSQVLKAAVQVWREGVFRVPLEMSYRQRREFVQRVSRLLDRASEELLRSIYYILYSEKEESCND